MFKQTTFSKLIIISLLLITLIGIAIGAAPNPGHDASQIDFTNAGTATGFCNATTSCGITFLDILNANANAGAFTGTAYIGQTANFSKWKLAVRNDNPGTDGGAIHGYSQNAIGIYGWAGGGLNPLTLGSYANNAGVVGYNYGANPGGTFISEDGPGLVAETRDSTANPVALELIEGGIQFDDGTIQSTAATGSGTGDITGVTAGTGLSGGGTSGTVILNANPETDPQVGTIQDNKWCRGETSTNPDTIICDKTAAITVTSGCHWVDGSTFGIGAFGSSTCQCASNEVQRGSKFTQASGTMQNTYQQSCWCCDIT